MSAELAGGDKKTPFWKLFFVIAVSTACLVFLVVFPRSSTICENSIPFALVISVYFATVAGILGGHVTSTRGYFLHLPIPLVGRFSGATGGALLGFFASIAAFNMLKPTECGVRDALLLAHVPTQQVSRSGAAYNAHLVQRAGIRVEALGTGSENDFLISLPHTGPIELKIRFYPVRTARNSSIPNQNLEPFECVIRVDLNGFNPDDYKDGSFAVYRIDPGSHQQSNSSPFLLTYDEGYLNRVETNLGISENFNDTCLSAETTRLASNEGHKRRSNIAGRLYLSSQSLFSLSLFEKLVSSKLSFLDRVSSLYGDLQTHLYFVEERSTRNVANSADGANTVVELPPVPPSPFGGAKPYIPVPAGTPKEIGPPSIAGPIKPINTPVEEKGPSAPAPSLISTYVEKIPPDVRSYVAAFLGGDDLTSDANGRLSKRWPAFESFVWQIIDATDTSNMEKARAIRLVATQLRLVDPAWQIRSGQHRDFAKLPQTMTDSKVDRIFQLLVSKDADIRVQAIYFLRLYPLDRFDLMFEESKHRDFSLGERSTLAVAASYFYYNRMVENLFWNASHGAIASLINSEFAKSQTWMGDELWAQSGKSAPAFRSMLIYAKAIVERERKIGDGGRADFSNMIEVLKQTDAAYPSRYQHVAQALAIGFQESGITDDQIRDDLGRIENAEAYLPETFIESDPTLLGPSYPIYPAPADKLSRTPFDMLEGKEGIRLLLKSGSWILIHGRGHIGWIKTSH
jgi:hypothetical protein